MSVLCGNHLIRCGSPSACSGRPPIWSDTPPITSSCHHFKSSGSWRERTSGGKTNTGKQLGLEKCAATIVLKRQDSQLNYRRNNAQLLSLDVCNGHCCAKQVLYMCFTCATDVFYTVVSFFAQWCPLLNAILKVCHRNEPQYIFLAALAVLCLPSWVKKTKHKN